MADAIRLTAEEFLSTLPARGATRRNRHRLPPGLPFLSTLPARGATLTVVTSLAAW